MKKVFSKIGRFVRSIVDNRATEVTFSHVPTTSGGGTRFQLLRSRGTDTFSPFPAGNFAAATEAKREEIRKYVEAFGFQLDES